MKILDHGLDTLEQIFIPKALLTQIESYCLAERELERCGLVGGRGENAISFYPTDNIAEDCTHQFLVDPKGQLKAFKTMRAKREELLAIVHSHPTSPAQPSETDLAMAAYPGVAYLIVSLAKASVECGFFVFEQAGFRELPSKII